MSESRRTNQTIRNYVATAHDPAGCSGENFALILHRKREELAEEIEHHRRELQRLVDELGHVDATFRLFDPSYDLGGTRARKWGHRTQWFGPGECQRLVLEVLREASKPLSGSALTQALIAHKGLESRREVRVAVNKTAMAVLRRLVAKGVVRRLELSDGTRVWERLSR